MADEGFVDQLGQTQGNRDTEMTNLTDFLYSRSRYYGQVKPENLVCNANLQEFSQRVGLICGLETGGKVSQDYYLDNVHFNRGKVGTVFEGEAQLNLTIGELLRKQAKF